jgi:hypothetical protein
MYEISRNEVELLECTEKNPQNDREPGYCTLKYYPRDKKMSWEV